MERFDYCPKCGVQWDDNDRVHGCVCCGYVQDKGDGVKMVYPGKCDEHPKYKGLGAPTSDCLVCWQMHLAYVESKVAELEVQNGA